MSCMRWCAKRTRVMYAEALYEHACHICGGVLYEHAGHICGGARSARGSGKIYYMGMDDIVRALWINY